MVTLLQPCSGGTSGRNVALRILAFAWPFVVWITKGGREDSDLYETLPFGTGEEEAREEVAAEDEEELDVVGGGEAEEWGEGVVGGIDGN